jgi:predicted O-methyltransferase YrrM
MINRIELAQYFTSQGFRIGAEVGVADGRYSEILCNNIPDLKLYCIDPYITYNENSQDGNQQQQNKCEEIAKRRLGKFNITFIKEFSTNALKFLNEELDFVYIDANHKFDYVMTDIILWSKKVKSGGIVAGHDYWSIRDFGVKDAVDAYTKAHHIELNIIEGEKSRRLSQAAPNWWFIK